MDQLDALAGSKDGGWPQSGQCPLQSMGSRATKRSLGGVWEEQGGNARKREISVETESGCAALSRAQTEFGASQALSTTQLLVQNFHMAMSTHCAVDAVRDVARTRTSSRHELRSICFCAHLLHVQHAC